MTELLLFLLDLTGLRHVYITVAATGDGCGWSKLAHTVATGI
jgi:hypothetical protein